MLQIKGDLWKLHDWGNTIAITTNGVIKADGEAVMGAGTAYEAKIRFPKLPKLLAERLIASQGPRIEYFEEYNLFAFPTKYDWRKNSDIHLIANSAVKLTNYILEHSDIFKGRAVFIPKPGCGLGGLDWKNVELVLAGRCCDQIIVVHG